jgi:hypothetical protein
MTSFIRPVRTVLSWKHRDSWFVLNWNWAPPWPFIWMCDWSFIRKWVVVLEAVVFVSFCPRQSCGSGVQCDGGPPPPSLLCRKGRGRLLSPLDSSRKTVSKRKQRSVLMPKMRLWFTKHLMAGTRWHLPWKDDSHYKVKHSNFQSTDNRE